MTRAVHAGSAEAEGPAEGPAPPRTAGLGRAQAEELVLALVLTMGVSRIPRWRVFEQAWVRDWLGVKDLPWSWYAGLLFLGFALALALSAPDRSGLRVGAIRAHWKKVLVVCGGSVLVAALVYPRLPTRPFDGASATMWVLSPMAQELLFLGYIYGRLERAFPGHVRPGIPLARALVVTMLFFALWHVPNFFGMPTGYVLFQLFYTGVLGIIPGLSRQWTGSIYYAVLTHSAINFIAWYAS